MCKKYFFLGRGVEVYHFENDKQYILFRGITSVRCVTDKEVFVAIEHDRCLTTVEFDDGDKAGHFYKELRARLERWGEVE